MKVSLRWMQDYIDLPTTDPEELAAVCASLGHQVEGYEVLAPTFAGVVVGKVLTVAAHPDADRIRLCTVDTGTGVAEVVCGAWNFDAGAVVPVAVPGATLDSGAFEITRRTIRGVVSNGMIWAWAPIGTGFSFSIPVCHSGVTSVPTSNCPTSCSTSPSRRTVPMR